jgi:molybdopterin synthase sulfur carrier subunit
LELLSNALIDKYGSKLKDILSTSMYAVDMEYIDKEDEVTTIIKPNAEIAIIPPVSGG